MNPERHAYLDRVRGVAVLIMIEAHVLDSWTRATDRSHAAFGYGIMVGGMGAPLFLFLAGVAVVLSAESKSRRTGDFAAAWRAAGNRGWQVFALAFLFRFQSYVLSGGSDVNDLLKVDILNIMGPAIVATAAVGGLVANRKDRAALLGVIAIVIAMLTPGVRATSLLSGLPDPVEWYFRPFPGRANFTLFPWAGFVFAGAMVGVAVDWGKRMGRAPQVQVRLAISAMLVAVAAYAASFLPSLYSTGSVFWTSSPSFFVLRVGLIALLIPLAFSWERASWRGKLSSWSPLESFGKASLFVYWVHVEMVYGLLSRPVRGKLSLWAVLLAYGAFTAFLLGVVLVKNRLFEGRKQPGIAHRGPTPASI